MAMQGPLKLLEIKIISAQDLPPVSKMLRTFAVAYVHPDHKLTTKIDHRGHTNPTWNYKVAFHVDDRFLRHESSAVTIEIYNLAWLRDLPIGTTRLLINNLAPPLRKNPNFRRVSLQICRPSGHLQGTLHLGVTLIDNNTAPSSIAPSLFSVKTDEEDRRIDEEQKALDREDLDLEDKNSGSRIASKDGSICASPVNSRPGTEPETRTSCGSLFSAMRPLPSEVADDMKKGLYSWNDYGSSIFDDWTEGGDRSEDRDAMELRNVEWPGVEDQIPFVSTASDTTKSSLGSHRPRRSAKKKKGLFSCFGNAYGFQFSFICGSNTLMMKKKKKNWNVNKHNAKTVPDDEDNLRRFYV